MNKAHHEYEIILIGDSGNIKRNQTDSILQLLKNHLPQSKNSMVIFLGDNIYPKGLPPENDPLRKDAEAVLMQYYQALENFKGKLIFISGNHDWNKGKPDGLKYVLRQEEYIKKLFKNVYYIPEGGCPGPREFIVNDEITIVAINTQWWVQKGKKPIGEKNGCNVESEEDFFKKLKLILDNNKEKKILVLGHYPIYSYSLHGGSYKIKHHIFPLTLYKRNALLPLPFVGSLLPLYRKYIGAREDLSHPKFKTLRLELKDLFKNYPGLMYAAGHEHNLQYIEKNHNHYIISGAASKSTYVVDGKYSKFSSAKKGFIKLKFKNNNKVKIEALIVNENNEFGELAYESWIV